MWKVFAIIAVLCASVHGIPPVHHRPSEINSSDPVVVQFEEGLEAVEESFYAGAVRTKNMIDHRC